MSFSDYSGASVKEVAESGLRTRDEFAAYMIPIIGERRDNLGDDLLSVLCRAEIDGTRMSDEDIKAFCSLLLTAGGETTTAFTAAADHLAFALGRHFCVGALLAETEVKVAVSQLLDAMPDVRLAEDLTPVEQGVFTRGPAELLLRFTPEDPARSEGSAWPSRRSR